ncbi:P-II family nitrogen regulator [Bartonella sp. B17]
MVIANKKLEQIINAILKAAKTKHIGNRKIFVFPIDEVIRISIRESGNDAL